MRQEGTTMRLGLSISHFTWSPEQELLGDTFSLLVERAERAGFYSLWVGDHFFQIPWLGRPYEQIEKTLVYFLHLTRDGREGSFSPQAAIECFADLAAEGFDQV